MQKRFQLEGNENALSELDRAAFIVPGNRVHSAGKALQVGDHSWSSLEWAWLWRTHSSSSAPQWLSSTPWKPAPSECQGDDDKTATMPSACTLSCC